MIYDLWSVVGWVMAAGVAGFAISAIFAGWLKFSRHRFLIPYVLLVTAFLCAFTLLNEIDLAALMTGNLAWGVLTGASVSTLLVVTVKRQPQSRQASGAALVLDVIWAGLIYGLVDSLFLNVMPVVAVWLGTVQFDWTASAAGRAFISIAGLLASLLVTLTYHLGYPEFRNRKVGMVLAGNSVITLAFLLSSNPLGSIISHTAMHVAAVLQGPETTIQLPPHYGSQALEQDAG